jgi:hypothetical protein
MNVKLFSTKKVEIEKMEMSEARQMLESGEAADVLPPDYGVGSKLCTVYVNIPKSEQKEELLGEFPARQYTAPNGSEWLEVNHGRGLCHFRLPENTTETKVNIFRFEAIS